jgi:hypothetical protein
LAVTLRSDAEVDGSEQVQLGIYVTPYARERYAFLARHLAPATGQHVGPVPGDVMWVDAALRPNRGKTLHVHLALQDRAIKYRVNAGQLATEEPLSGGSFSASSQYLAVTPAGLDGLKFVQQFVHDLQAPSSPVQVARGASSGSNPLVSFARFFLGSRAGRILEMMFVASTVTTKQPFTIFARDEQLRGAIVDQLRLGQNGPRTQIHLAVVDPDQTQVADYLHAYAFVEARRASAMNAQLLNDLPQQLGLPPKHSPRLAREILGAAPICPLDGQYRLTGEESRQIWRSTAWREGSVHDVQQVPDGYRFPFLQWLRGIDVRFMLSDDTLKADVILNVKPTSGSYTSDSDRQDPGVAVDSLRADDIPAVGPTPLASGDAVVVASPRADLRIGGRTVRQLRRDTRLFVVEVRGDWIGVEVTISGRVLRGWVKRSELRR